jgi:hypothetical protein
MQSKGDVIMALVITIAAACGVFAFCFAVFLVKARREGGPPRLHRCGQGPDCHCYGKGSRHQPFDLIQVLDQAKTAGCQGQRIDKV